MNRIDNGARSIRTVQDYIVDGGLKGILFSGEFFRAHDKKVYEILDVREDYLEPKKLQAEIRIFGEKYAYWFELEPHIRDFQATPLEIKIAKESPFATETVEIQPQVLIPVIEESYDPFSSCYFRDPSRDPHFEKVQ